MDRLPIPVFLGFPCGSASKDSACHAGDLGSTSGLGRSPGEGKGYPLQYSGLENSMDCIVHGVAKSQTQLSNFHFNDLKGQVRTWKAGFKCRILRVSCENTEEEPDLDLQPGLLIVLIPHHCTPWGSCELPCGHPSPHIQDLPTSSRMVIPSIPTNLALLPAAEFTFVWSSPELVPPSLGSRFGFPWAESPRYLDSRHVEVRQWRLQSSWPRRYLAHGKRHDWVS